MKDTIVQRLKDRLSVLKNDHRFISHEMNKRNASDGIGWQGTGAYKAIKHDHILLLSLRFDANHTIGFSFNYGEGDIKKSNVEITLSYSAKKVKPTKNMSIEEYIAYQDTKGKVEKVFSNKEILSYSEIKDKLDIFINKIENSKDKELLPIFCDIFNIKKI